MSSLRCSVTSMVPADSLAFDHAIDLLHRSLKCISDTIISTRVCVTPSIKILNKRNAISFEY